MMININIMQLLNCSIVGFDTRFKVHISYISSCCTCQLSISWVGTVLQYNFSVWVRWSFLSWFLLGCAPCSRLSECRRVLDAAVGKWFRASSHLWHALSLSLSLSLSLALSLSLSLSLFLCLSLSHTHTHTNMMNTVSESAQRKGSHSTEHEHLSTVRLNTHWKTLTHTYTHTHTHTHTLREACRNRKWGAKR